ncbi:hypothetical protein OG802_33280 [Streptomyces sp. NBC_00704]|uniref:hypothetical protein n=1 Tax=Streptomyces sp. NBC_00704 TaxID=2975809 RepID=UPI002E30C2FB|nr:hypothetical protein [Streptomyces sp. NBC_00704]
MNATPLDGRATAAAVRRELTQRVAESTAVVGRPPGDRVAPMPGGVGPMTRAMPPADVAEAAERNDTAV